MCIAFDMKNEKQQQYEERIKGTIKKLRVVFTLAFLQLPLRGFSITEAWIINKDTRCTND